MRKLGWVVAVVALVGSACEWPRREPAGRDLLRVRAAEGQSEEPAVYIETIEIRPQPEQQVPRKSRRAAEDTRHAPGG